MRRHDSARRVRDRGRREHAHDAQHLERVAEHGVDLRARARPSTARWSRGRRWCRGSAATSPRAPRRARTRSHAAAACRRRPSAASARERAVGLRRRSDAAAFARRPRRRHARREVAEVVGEVGVVAVDHAFVREVAVVAEVHVAQEVVAVAVDAEVGEQVARRDLVELASCSSSRHRRAGSRAPARACGGSMPAAMQHRRPPHAVEPDDVLADDVVARAATTSNRASSAP